MIVLIEPERLACPDLTPRYHAQVLDAAGIAHAGAGLLPEAPQAAVIEAAGLRVSFMSFADHYDSWAASQQVGGPASCSQHMMQQSVQHTGLTATIARHAAISEGCACCLRPPAWPCPHRLQASTT